MDDIAPPGPPPLLDSAHLQHLVRHGYVGIDLAPHLAQQMINLFTQSSDFFHLPAGSKARLYPATPGNTEQGYTDLTGEKEYVTLRYLPTRSGVSLKDPIAAAAAAQLDTMIRQVWHDIAHLLYRILRDLSAHLGHITPTAWDSLVESSLSVGQERNEHARTLMRIFRYEPFGGVADPHRDLGILTLCVCRGRGLQMLDRSKGPSSPQISSEDGPQNGHSQLGDVADTTSNGSSVTASPLPWIDAPEVVVMAGDTLRILSSNRVPAASHRVVATDRGRQSIVFALRASTQHPLNLEEFGGFGVIDSLALWNRIRGNRVNVNAEKGVREEMREKFRRKKEAELVDGNGLQDHAGEPQKMTTKMRQDVA
jgi:isopenicillin N synthase-like dioxygenase